MKQKKPKIEQMLVLSKSGSVIDFSNFIKGEQIQAKLGVHISSNLLGDRLAGAKVDFTLINVNITEEELGKVVQKTKKEEGDFFSLKEKVSDNIGAEYSIAYEVLFDVSGIEEWEDVIDYKSVLDIVGPYINKQVTEFFREAGNSDFNLPFDFWQNN